MADLDSKSIKIKDLPIINTVDTDSLFIIETATGTKAISFSDMLACINSNIGIPEPDIPAYNPEDYIITETFEVTDDTIVLENVAKLLYVKIYDGVESDTAVTELEIVATNSSYGPKKLTNDTTIYQDLSGTVEIFNNSLHINPQGRYPYKLEVKYAKIGIHEDDIPAMLYSNKTVTTSIISSGNSKSIYNAYNPEFHLKQIKSGTITIGWQGSIKYSQSSFNGVIRYTQLQNYTNGESLTLSASNGGEIEVTIVYD